MMLKHGGHHGMEEPSVKLSPVQEERMNHIDGGGMHSARGISEDPRQ